ncbi:MAG: hypothetical protein IT305_22485 [Chloroflexi bacterium]|nr:hypothetical protein [Chloroflexota bacterium]
MPTIRVFQEADVTCYHCGFVSGVARIDRGAPSTAMTFLERGSDVETPLRDRKVLRCTRCKGPTYFDEFQSRTQMSTSGLFDDQPRRGRPPKRLAQQRLAEQQAARQGAA